MNNKKDKNKKYADKSVLAPLKFNQNNILDIELDFELDFEATPNMKQKVIDFIAERYPKDENTKHSNKILNIDELCEKISTANPLNSVNNDKKNKNKL